MRCSRAWGRAAEPVAVARAYLASVSRNGGRYAAAAAALGMRQTGGLLHAGTRAGSAVRRRVGDAVRGQHAWTDAEGRWHLAVDLTGAAGATVTTHVRVPSRRGDERPIGLSAGPFRAAGDGERFHPGLQIEPDQVSVRPGAEQTVTLRLHLNPALFAAGQTYYGRVEVTGGETGTIHIRVRVAGG